MSTPSYLPEQFRVSDELAMAIMKRYPFASVISNGEEGMPIISHVPLVVKQHADGVVELHGHVAKANPHWQTLEANPHALVSFQGPSAYLSPQVYPDLQRVPTWSYVVVDAEVSVAVEHDENRKDALLKRLIMAHEPPYAQQWHSLPHDYKTRMLSAVVGFRLTVTRLHAKVKLNQHRPESHAAMHATYSQGTPAQRELAGWMEQLGMGPAP